LPSGRQYILTQNNFINLKNRYKDDFKCYQDGCDVPFKVGDEIVSRLNKWTQVKWFHLKCWESKFVDV